ncbi:N-(5'-phosphoribosyl)anthranilate isomerase [Polymorphobacter glacialis]|uniref:N-(5'-phosphoribosyl)anthranilate isomerase n=1 Tax=Sandarakinorhabdus glacialis TaxID=1614636 RepID=A0A916ZQB4_9SPHN|nr:phosphoribosylanthranilate isomerase [Polymorphobacter glacialis]GGE07805.1 N-(5'-phosphoribosyl)anthranilate isomerase [Polymorphobacter glacialis]
MASVAEMRLAVAAGADAVGLVGRMPSGPGPIGDDLIAEIAAAVPPPVAAFLLTSETDAEAIADHVRRTGVPVVQIVSHIAPAESARLARLIPATRRVQVVHVEGAGAIDMIADYTPHVHAFLLDSGRPGAAVPTLGGTGDVHDWDISARFVAASKLPVFLAGGLTAANVGEAIARVRPFGVDLCSGIRTAGALDSVKLAAFVAAVR